jgi:Fe2+ transport system protein FeoA
MLNLKIGDKIKIIDFNCGTRAYLKLQRMNIRYDSILKIMAIQPYGPITVKTGNSEYTIGKMLFDKLIYEVIEE